MIERGSIGERITSMSMIEGKSTENMNHTHAHGTPIHTHMHTHLKMHGKMHIHTFSPS